jgi:hypothetical protein
MTTTTLPIADTPPEAAHLGTRGRLAMQIIAGSLALGAAGDGLLRAVPWGINFVFWLTALLGFTGWLMSRHGRPPNRRAIWLGLAAWVFACGVAWRSSPTLTPLNIFAAAGFLAAGLACARGERLFLGGVFEHLWRFAGAVGGALAGYIPLFLGESWWTPQATVGWGSRLRAMTIGVLLAIPLLVVFGVLLASADAVFHSLLARFLDFDLPEVVSHVIPIALCAWVVAGWLVALLFHGATDARPTSLPQVLTLGTVEIGVALGLVNALFAAFLLVQAGHLFGGDEWVQLTPGLTYAEYARRGFFELVAVVVIALPVLLTADWLLGANRRRGFRCLAGLMVAMLSVILASAWHRMRLYQAEFGWTELRFFVTAFMLWLAAILVWFSATVLTGRRGHFTGGALVAGVLLIIGLNARNPAEWIAQKNLAHAQTGHGFDVNYAVQLGDDAVPILLAGMNTLSPEDRLALQSGWATAMPVTTDWRSWNWSRTQARQQLLAAGIEPDAEAPHGR